MNPVFIAFKNLAVGLIPAIHTKSDKDEGKPEKMMSGQKDIFNSGKFGNENVNQKNQQHRDADRGKAVMPGNPGRGLIPKRTASNQVFYLHRYQGS